jgi:chemotaxis signal transduction protein
MSSLMLESPSYEVTDLLDFGPRAQERQPPPAVQRKRFVTFYQGDHLYGLASDEVAEVVHPLPVSPLPNGPRFVQGISPLRGDIVAVINLKQLLGAAGTPAPERPKFVILKSIENEMRVAFRVDAMHELITLTDGDLRTDEQLGSLLFANATVDGRYIRMIHPPTLRTALDTSNE